MIFIFSYIWSICCTVDYNGRQLFNKFIQKQIEKADLGDKVKFPKDCFLYDFRYNIADDVVEPWTQASEGYFVDPKKSFSEIVVPTNDNIRMMYLMKLLTLNKHHVLCPGPTGTGKSINVMKYLSEELPNTFQYITISFSAQTNANQTQDTIADKLEKRRKGVFGLPSGKEGIIFVDDLNMPKKEQYGAQPPIEIVRQILDHKGWYNRKSLLFEKLEGLVFLSAMGPPGGGRTRITDRMSRHFNVISYTEVDDQIIN